jgi:hypothetical protein
MSTASPAEKAAFSSRRYLERNDMKLDPDTFVDPVQKGYKEKAGLTTPDLQERKLSTLLERMQLVAKNAKEDSPVEKNAYMVYTYDKLLAVLANFRADPRKMVRDCKNNYYKFGKDCEKIDKLIAVELFEYATKHPMKEPIHQNPDYWINIPVFLEGTNYALFSMFDTKDQWQPPASEVAGTPDIVKAYNPDGPTADWIVEKMDMFNKIFPGYGISSIDLYMLAKLGWLLDSRVQRKAVSLIEKNDKQHYVQTVIQYVPTLRAIVLYNYNFRKPQECKYLPLDVSLGRRAGKDQSPTHYTEGVYKFLMDHFNKNSVGQIMLPGLKFTADELVAWMSMLDVKKLERGTIAKMINEATLESWQKERLSQILHLYWDMKTEDRAAEIDRLERELVANGASIVYNRLISNLLAAGHTEPMITHLGNALRTAAGFRPNPDKPGTVTARIHPEHVLFGRRKPPEKNKPV